jgi:hypothetical protein
MDSAIGGMSNESVQFPTTELVTFAEQLRSSTSSLSSSMYEYVVSHGRMYHKYKEGSKLSISIDEVSLMILF